MISEKDPPLSLLIRETLKTELYQVRTIGYVSQAFFTPPLNPLPVYGEGRQSKMWRGWGSPLFMILFRLIKQI